LFTNICIKFFIVLFYPLKRNRQHNNVYNKTPSAQISVGGPAYSILLTISGAMYEGDTQNILTLFSWGMHVEKPKSFNLTRVLVSSNKIISNLISL
jgi:hypothetical protein